MTTRLPLKDFEFIIGLRDFARSKGDEEYNFCDPWQCAVAQFGYPGLNSDGIDDDGAQIAPWAVMNAAVAGRFDLLATRLDALLVDAPVVERVS